MFHHLLMDSFKGIWGDGKREWIVVFVEPGAVPCAWGSGGTIGMCVLQTRTWFLWIPAVTSCHWGLHQKHAPSQHVFCYSNQRVIDHHFSYINMWIDVDVCLYTKWVCVCVSVCERERESERKGDFFLFVPWFQTMCTLYWNVNWRSFQQS